MDTIKSTRETTKRRFARRLVKLSLALSVAKGARPAMNAGFPVIDGSVSGSVMPFRKRENFPSTYSGPRRTRARTARQNTTPREPGKEK